MTSIAKDFASKAAVAFVAVAMIFTMFAPAAQAQSTEDLQKMIDELMAQIEALKGGSTATTGGSSAGVCPFTWTRDLRTGVSGADVKALQQFLNADADTRVAATGAGSAGMETETFGPMTAAAVSKFQVKYRADILTPAGLVNPTGFFGPGTRAKANALCVATSGGDMDEDEDEGSEDEDEDMGDLQGEGSLDTFEIDEASDTDIQEGAEDEVIAELTMEATDGDIEVDRMDLTIETDGDNTENDPWEVFEEISVWVDGEKIADFDASDEDNYLDEDDGTFRFTNLGLVLREDEEVEVLIGATVAGSVDDAGQTDEDDWTIAVDEVRYFDADGVAEDDDTTGDLGDTAAFNIVEEGDGEELNFSLGDGNPDATDIVVDTDSKTDGVTVMEYTIESEEGDIELNTLFVKLTTSTTSDKVIDDVTLDIDGDTFDAENSASTTNTNTTFEFDIDGDVVVEDGEEVTVKVMVDFRAQEVSNGVPRYNNGDTIKAEVTSTERDLTDAEGAADVDTFSGSAIGETHTLVAEGIVVPVDGVVTEFDTQGTNDTTGIFSIDFEVTAVEADFYVREFATLGATTTGVTFSLETPAGYSAGSSTVSGVLSSTADEDTSGVFTVREGETETFTLTVTVDPNVAGNYRVGLTGVYYTENTNGITGSTLYTPTPAQDFRTDFENINQ